MFGSLSLCGKRVATFGGNVGSIRLISTTVTNFNTTTQQPRESRERKFSKMKSRSQWAQKDLSDTSSQEDLIDNLGKISETTATKVEPPIYISPSLHRNFRMGDTYTPFDFSMNRFDMEHKIKASKKLVDPFATSGINPKYLYLMPELLSKYLTSTGQILPRSATGCSAANQVKLAKAVETARCLGLLSTKHRHARYLPVRNL